MLFVAAAFVVLYYSYFLLINISFVHCELSTLLTCEAIELVYCRLFLDKNSSSKYSNQWRDLCEHTEKGLESKSWSASCSNGKFFFVFWSVYDDLFLM